MTRLVAMFGLCSLSCLFSCPSAGAVPPPLDTHHPLGGLRWQAHPGCLWGDGWDSWPLADFPVTDSGAELSIEVAAQLSAELSTELSTEPSRDWQAGWELQVAPPVDLEVWPAGWAEAAYPVEAVAADAASPGPLQSVLIQWRRAAAEQHLEWVSERFSRWSDQLGGAVDGELVGEVWGSFVAGRQQLGHQLALWAPPTLGYWTARGAHEDGVVSSPEEAQDAEAPHLAAGASEALTH